MHMSACFLHNLSYLAIPRRHAYACKRQPILGAHANKLNMLLLVRRWSEQKNSRYQVNVKHARFSTAACIVHLRVHVDNYYQFIVLIGLRQLQEQL
jgi:hypothetical protein